MKQDKQKYRNVRMWPESYARHQKKAARAGLKMPEYFDRLSKDVPIRNQGV